MRYSHGQVFQCLLWTHETREIRCFLSLDEVLLYPDVQKATAFSCSQTIRPGTDLCSAIKLRIGLATTLWCRTTRCFNPSKIDIAMSLASRPKVLSATDAFRYDLRLANTAERAYNDDEACVPTTAAFRSKEVMLKKFMCLQLFEHHKTASMSYSFSLPTGLGRLSNSLFSKGRPFT